MRARTGVKICSHNGHSGAHMDVPREQAGERGCERHTQPTEQGTAGAQPHWKLIPQACHDGATARYPLSPLPVSDTPPAALGRGRCVGVGVCTMGRSPLSPSLTLPQQDGEGGVHCGERDPLSPASPVQHRTQLQGDGFLCLLPVVTHVSPQKSLERPASPGLLSVKYCSGPQFPGLWMTLPGGSERGGERHVRSSLAALSLDGHHRREKREQLLSPHASFNPSYLRGSDFVGGTGSYTPTVPCEPVPRTPELSGQRPLPPSLSLLSVQRVSMATSQPAPRQPGWQTQCQPFWSSVHLPLLLHSPGQPSAKETKKENARELSTGSCHPQTHR